MTRDQAITLSLSALALAVSLLSLIYGIVVDRRIERRRRFTVDEAQRFITHCDATPIKLDCSPAHPGDRAPSNGAAA